jgi:hypothetical protein
MLKLVDWKEWRPEDQGRPPKRFYTFLHMIKTPEPGELSVKHTALATHHCEHRWQEYRERR